MTTDGSHDETAAKHIADELADYVKEIEEFVETKVKPRLQPTTAEEETS